MSWLAGILGGAAYVGLIAAMVAVALPFHHVPHYAPTYHQQPQRTDGYPGGKKRG